MACDHAFAWMSSLHLGRNLHRSDRNKGNERRQHRLPGRFLHRLVRRDAPAPLDRPAGKRQHQSPPSIRRLLHPPRVPVPLPDHQIPPRHPRPDARLTGQKTQSVECQTGVAAYIELIDGACTFPGDKESHDLRDLLRLN